MSTYAHHEDHGRPMSLWAYIGYTVLFLLPVVGLIALIVFAIKGGNINRRNYARALLILMIVFVVLVSWWVSSAWRILQIQLTDGAATILEKLRLGIVATLQALADMVSGNLDVPPTLPDNPAATPSPALAPAGG